VAGCCEHGTEIFGSIKDGKAIDFRKGAVLHAAGCRLVLQRRIRMYYKW
jgi:hypothetical protein